MAIYDVFKGFIAYHQQNISDVNLKKNVTQLIGVLMLMMKKRYFVVLLYLLMIYMNRHIKSHVFN